ncbi:MAG: DUF4190 domain-containing protein [Planctomycetia bacterium]|nr:DUF4190 domain-containing protein [Planctomycetia bacterium]
MSVITDESRDLEPVAATVVPDRIDDFSEPYRALSASAVVSCVLGLLSILAFADFWLGLIPLLAIVTGVLAWRKIARSPEEYTGLRLAQSGVTLGALLWTGGASWLSYVYATEVPDGYERITYRMLQPGDNDVAGAVPAQAESLDGKRVFIKGYIYPPPGSPPYVTRFLLVRDKGDCCFGGNPKITDRILVDIAPPGRLEFNQSLRKLAGTFRLQPSEAVDAEGGVLYRLEADYAK